MRSIFLSLLLISTYVAFGQEESSETQTTTVSSNQDRLVIDLTFDNWFHEIDQLKTKWYSRGLGAFFMYDIIIMESKFSFAPGLGVTSNSIYMNGLLIDPDSGSTYLDFANFNENTIKKYKFNTVFLEVPVELRFRSNQEEPSKAFKIAIGFKAGLRIDAKTKTKVEIGDEVKVYKEKRWDDAATFRAGPTFRIGYGPVNVVVFYSIMDVFKNDRGPQLTPFSIGLSLNGL